MTWEITGSTTNQRAWLQGFIGILIVEFERIDSNTWNVTVPDDKADDVVEWASDNDLECRLV
jgi:hypothetical protein